MKKFTYKKPFEIPDHDLTIAIIFARFEGKWMFCRHKARKTWETPGGHRETGETIEYAARRELMEETGAEDFEIAPVCAVCDESYSGMVYFAEVRAFSCLSETSEMAEVRLFDFLPDSLTYPELCISAFHRVQGYLNIQSNAGELWDVYDENRNVTGRVHRRGDEMNPGEYHLVVHVWIQNSLGEYLITKRAPNKGFPNMWETTGGSALQGDDSLTAALREVKEETGLDLDPSCGKCILSYKRSDTFTDVWLFMQEFDLEKVVLQAGETTDKMKADKNKIRALVKEGAFVPFTYLNEMLDERI